MFPVGAVDSASDLLNTEFDTLSFDVSGAAETINNAVNSGLTPGQAILVMAGVPILYKVLQIAQGYTETHQKKMLNKDDEVRAQNDHNRELERMDKMEDNAR